MPLIDTSMYGNYREPDYAGNFMRGMQAGQQYKQNRQASQQQEAERKENQRFEQTLRGLVQVNDIQTPEGQKGLLRDLSNLGFGKQALGLMGQLPKPQGQDWSNIPGTNTLYERGSGTFKDTGASRMPKAEIAPPPPVLPGQPPAAPTWKGEKFMRTKGNTMVKVDANGYAQDGSKPEGWLPPVKPGGGPNRQDRQQVIGLENQLRDEYEKGAIESRTIARAGQDIAAALKTNNSLSIGTAISKFSKLKDPTTGVLGGEADVTEKAAMGDAWNRMLGAAQKTAVGGATPETIASFKAATQDLMRVQKSVFARMQNRTKSRFESYKSRFPDMNISLDAVMGKEEDRANEMAMFDAFSETASDAVARPKTREEKDKLPKGTKYIGPDGKVATKQ